MDEFDRLEKARGLREKFNSCLVELSLLKNELAELRVSAEIQLLVNEDLVNLGYEDYKPRYVSHMTMEL